MIRRRDLHDVYTEAGRTVVMIGEQIIVLSELATTILDAVPVGSSVGLDEIVDSVVAEFGPPPLPDDALTLTEQNVHDLVAHGVLEIETDPAHDDRSRDPREATAALQRAMATVLTQEPGLRWRMPEDLTPGSFLAAVRRQRIGAQLATGLDRLDLPGQMRARLRADSDDMRAACNELGHHLHRALDVLSETGVGALTFKGLALASQAWGDDGARGYGDLDMLVAPADLDRAVAALVADGWQYPSRYPLPGPGWGWRQFVRTSYEMPLVRGSTILDLHWHAVPARNTFPIFDDLWRRRADVAVLGRPVPTLSPYDALAHSASHSAKDHWRWLRGLADVHRLMSAPETWSRADRPLRHDQLLSVGIAARLFGVPDRAPAVVRKAFSLSGREYSSSLEAQVRPEHAAARSREAYMAILRSYPAMWRTRPGTTDLGRHVLRTALPARFLADETSPHAYVAAPRVLWHRGTEVAHRLATAIQ